MKRLFASLLGLLMAFVLPAQDTDILLNHELYPYLDRLDIKGVADTNLSSYLKPYGRDGVSQFLQQVNTESFTPLEKQWLATMRHLADDSYSTKTESKGLFQTFYKNKRDLYHHSDNKLTLFINPSLFIQGGIDNNTYPTAPQENLPIYYNSRGLVIRGSIMNKVGFYTEVYDNIARVPQYIFDRYTSTQVLDGESFVKRFGDKNGLDYLSARGYITFRPIQAIRVKLGKDKAFWGDGYQSLQLSDHAADYFFLSLHTKIWKLEYINHFTQMTDFIPNRNDTEGIYPKKYGVFHQLQFNPNSRFSIGIFESIIYNPWLANGRRGFELSYLNPLIFYRSAEQALGSPDNSFLGMNVKYNFLKRFQLYGQLLLDDFNFGRRDEGSGFVGNKWGYQMGLKYIDAFSLQGFDLQFEYNRVRPFTYQHFNISSNYAHFAQHLGHAAGANLYDYTIISRYKPFKRWNIIASFSQLTKGLDSENDSFNYGGDVNRAFINWPSEFGNEVSQGNVLTVSQLYSQVSFQLGSSDNYLEGALRYRREVIANRTLPQRSLSGYMGIRMSLVGKVSKF